MAMFKRALKKSCETSSMRALPRIMRSTTNFQLSLWILALLAGLCFGGYQLVKLLIQYFGYPTSVDIKEISGSPPFPDVTVCHLDLEWTTRKLHAVFGDDYDINRYKNKITNIMKDYPSNSTTYRLMHYMITEGLFGGYLQNIESPGADKLFKLVKEHLVRDCSSVLVADMMPHLCYQNNTYKAFLDPVFGLCITLQNTEVMSLNLLLYLDDTLEEKSKPFKGIGQAEQMSQVGARVIIHPHNSFPDMNFFSHYVLAGTEYDFDLVGRERVSLTSPYGTCVQTDPAHSEVKSSRHGFECYRLCGKHKALEKCNCLYLYYAQDDIKRTLCTHLEDDVSVTVQRAQCAYSAILSTNSNFKDLCDCPKPCQEFEYDYKSRTMPWPHHTYHLSFYSKYINGTSFQPKFNIYEDISRLRKSNETAALERLTQVDLISRNFARVRVLNHQWKYLKYTETPLLSIESIIGSVGGLCNLWAGISFFTFIEILDFLHQWLIQKAEMNGAEKKSKRQTML